VLDALTYLHEQPVSARTEQVIFKAMAIDPSERYQSARAMREALCPRRRFIALPF